MDRHWPFPISSWLDDETLFSLCSRIHRVSGNVFASVTCQQLFQHRTAGSQHDFPARIDRFVERSKGAYGQSNEIIARTLLPYFLPWKSETLAAQAMARVRHTNAGPLKFLLGISTSRFRAHLPLKACDGCISDDKNRNGVAYWHLTHQYPGVWICPRHHEPLREANVKATGVGRFLWFLPSDELLNPAPTLDSSAQQALLRFALLTLESVKALQERHIDSQRLAIAYASRLTAHKKEIGWDRPTNRTVGMHYSNSVAPLRQVAELSALAANAEQGRDQLARIQRSLNTSTHPLRHLSLIQWLYVDWADFWQHYSSTKASQPLCTDHPPSKPPPESSPGRSLKRQAFFDQLKQRSTSISAAARAVGISTNTAMAWATEAGIAVKQRPKLVHGSVREQVIQKLRTGENKQSVADTLGLSIQSITRVLQTEIGLRTAWREALNKRHRLDCRGKWTTAMKQNPNASKKTLRLIEPATFAWLYRNDLEWLNEKQLALRTIRSNNVSLDWDTRDTDLAHAVTKAALQCVLQHPAKKVTLQMLYQALPELKRRLSQLGRLPLTQAAIIAAITNGHAIPRNDLPLFGYDSQ